MPRPLFYSQTDYLIRLLIKINILNEKERCRSVGFFRSQQICTFTAKAYSSSAGPMQKSMGQVDGKQIFNMYHLFKMFKDPGRCYETPTIQIITLAVTIKTFCLCGAFSEEDCCVEIKAGSQKISSWQKKKSPAVFIRL